MSHLKLDNMSLLFSLYALLKYFDRFCRCYIYHSDNHKFDHFSDRRIIKHINNMHSKRVEREIFQIDVLAVLIIVNCIRIIQQLSREINF